jgi:tryptophan synthase alpha subunit
LLLNRRSKIVLRKFFQSLSKNHQSTILVSLSFQKRPALVVYVTCGNPNLAATRAIVLAAIEAGADIIELGVPFSDPVADGPVIQRASERALSHGTSRAAAR